MSGSVGLLDDPVEAPESIKANLGSFVPSTLGDVADPLSLSKELYGFLARQTERSMASGEPTTIGGVAQPTAPSTTLSPDEANERFGIKGPNGLAFKNPVPEDVARSLNQSKQNELALADARARRMPGTWNSIAALGANFVANAIDPLNIAASFIPVVGEERYAAWMAEAGDSIVRRLAVRAGVGAAQGAAGQLPLSAIRYGLSREDQSDYTAADVLGDVAMGGLMGAGFGSMGEVFDHSRVRAPRPTSITDAVSARFTKSPEAAVVEADPEVGASAVRTAIAQLVQGDPVEVEPVLAAPEVSTPAEPLAVRHTPASYATTPSGDRVPVQYELAELDSLQHASGALQPRERARASSEQQISSMAANLDPAQLTEGAGVGVGAPIVGPDSVIESGNGRIAAIRMAADRYAARYQAYVEALKSQGYDTDGMARPVLVRRRTNDMTEEERRAFVIDANRSPVMRLSAGEQAKSDAAALGRDELAQFNPDLQGGVLAAGNRDFVRSWLGKLPATERNAMLAPDGGLSAEGARRIQAALFARAYGDTPEVTRAFESADDDSKTITGALLDASSAWASMRVGAAAGNIPAQFDITPKLLRAIDRWRDARDKGLQMSSVLGQGDVFEASDPVTDLLFRSLLDPKMKRLAGRPKIADTLRRYAAEAERQEGGSSLFGETQAVTPETALQAIINARHEAAFAKATANATGALDFRKQRVSAAADKAAKIEADPKAAAKAARIEPEPAQAAEVAPHIVDAAELAKLKPDEAKVLHGAYVAAAEAKPGFDATLDGIARAVGGDLVAAPLKGAKRAVEKVIADYEGDASRIKDLLRGTIRVPSEAEGKRALADLKKTMKVLPGGRRSFKPDATGYSDMKVNVEVAPGLIAEVQFNTPEMLAAKEALHVHYEREAEIRRASPGRKLTEDEEAEIARGKAAMRAGYEDARLRASNRLRAARASTTTLSNSALETDAPLRSTESNGNQRPSGTSQAVASNLPASRVTGTPSTSKYSVFMGSSSSEDTSNMGVAAGASQPQARDLFGATAQTKRPAEVQKTLDMFAKATAAGFLTDADAEDVKAALDEIATHQATAKAASTAAECLSEGTLL